jgi:hypothetical protein
MKPDPYATPAQKRVDLIMCAMCAAMFVLVLITQAH